MTSKDDIAEALENLEAKGLIRDSGRRRDGEIVWVVTELGGGQATRTTKEAAPAPLETE
jgi:hypothetical protein